MQNKTKNIIITIVFVFILIATFLINLIVKDEDISISERRKLTQFPEIKIGSIFNDKFEKYAQDQFIERDLFRKIKSFWSIKIFGQKDYNKLFEKNNAIYKMEYPLNNSNVQKSAKKINDVYEKYLKNMNVYYSIIPEKNYYLENDNHLKIDQDKLQEIMKNELKELKYIDIKDGLNLDSYYRTDLHWKQESLDQVIRIIQKNMGIGEMQVDYKTIDKGEFYGSYYGQLATNILPDDLNILTNEIIESCNTYNFETQKNASIYNEIKSSDKYDIFVSGPTFLINIENPNAQTEKELILFRDSFGSSLAPLLVENYRKITLVDLRYISKDLLVDFIEFDNQDVLFLYSTVVLNQNILK